ncbi:MAG: tetratricopeptide repeat protein [Euryarchaeota archaeon]|nr:tetratricopeptide repeat protein [Euryarchaeota archaeon]
MPGSHPEDDRDLRVVDAYTEQDYVTALDAAEAYLEEWWDPLIAQLALLSQRWLGDPERERLMIEDLRNATDEDPWYHAVLDFHAGKIHIGELLDKASRPEQYAEAYFAAGSRALSDGDETGGRAWLQQCAETHVDTLEPEVAARELERLDEDGGLAGRLHRILETMRDALEDDDWDHVHGLLAPAWRLLRSGTGARHPLIAPLTLFHAEALWDDGEKEEAVVRAFQAVDAVKADTGADSPLPLVAARAAQEILFSWGDVTAADEMAELAGAARLGADGPDQDLLDAAVVAFRVGDLDTAFHAYEDAFTHQDPDDTPQAATERVRRTARRINALGDRRMTARLLERVLAESAEREEDDDPETLSDALVLAIALRKVGREEEAAALFEETVERVEASREWTADMRCEFYDFLAERHEEAGLFEHAEALYEEVVHRYTDEHGDDAADLVLPLIGLGRVYLATDRPDAALDAYQRAKDIYDKHGLRLLIGFLDHGRILEDGLLAAEGAVAEKALRDLPRDAMDENGDEKDDPSMTP